MTSGSPRIGAAILAAGASRRMGSAKALLQLDSRPLIQILLQSIRQSPGVTSIVVVTGHEHRLIEAAVADMAVETCFNSDHDSGGMLSSVKVGVGALASRCDALLIALLDQPLVRPATLATLVDRWKQTRAPLVLPSYNAKRGHPILVASTCADEIESLPNGATLRDFVAQHLSEAQVVPVADSGVVAVLDTPRDFENLKEQWRSLSCPTDQA